MKIKLKILKNIYSIYRFNAEAQLPRWIFLSEFYSITKTEEELSVVTHQYDSVKEECKINKNWRIIKVVGPLDFSLIGIIADISEILKQAKISIFVISTYDTDYVLVKDKDLIKATDTLKAKGYFYEEI